jgi:Tol biopolymer transport system component
MRLAIAIAAFTLAVLPGAQEITSNGDRPIVSPDGKRVAFSADRGDGYDLYVINADGTGEVRLTRDTVSEGKPRWSADGGQLTFAVFAAGSSTVYRINADGTQRQTVGTVAGRNPILLRDGKTVVYSRGGWTDMQIAITTLGDTAGRLLSDGKGAIWNVVVSPDEKRLAYSLNGSKGRIDVWTMNIDGTGARAVTNFPPSDGNAQAPAWSFDGKRLAVQSAVGDPKNEKTHIGNIWIVDLATGAATKLAPHNEPYLDELPAWFPDGKRIAFQSNRTGRWEVWVMNADETGAKQLTR